MQNNRFTVLTGHLSNYPLSDLVGILRHQQKTGRLLIEYPKGPATFFFHNGELIDARMNELTGLQAICVALAQPEAAFNFNPLIPPSRRSIEPSLQRAVSELFGCWDESALQIETTGAAPVAFENKPEPLALPPAPRAGLQQRSVFFLAGAVLTAIGLTTVITITGGFTGNPPVVTAAAAIPYSGNSLPTMPPAEKPEPRQTVPVKPKRQIKANDTEQKLQSIKVVMQIENGRVLKASIANHKPGMDSYEALALRIARQRRYPTTTTGGETVTISVSK